MIIFRIRRGATDLFEEGVDYIRNYGVRFHASLFFNQASDAADNLSEKKSPLRFFRLFPAKPEINRTMNAAFSKPNAKNLNRIWITL